MQISHRGRHPRLLPEACPRHQLDGRYGRVQDGHEVRQRERRQRETGEDKQKGQALLEDEQKPISEGEAEIGEKEEHVGQRIQLENNKDIHDDVFNFLASLLRIFLLECGGCFDRRS